MKYTVLLLTPLLCLLPLSARAIVNIEELRGNKAEDGMTVRASVMASGESGNTDKSEVSAAARLHWQSGPMESLLIGKYDYGESNHVRDTNKTFLHARQIRTYQPGRAVEAFVQAEKNEFARLDFRGLIGAGLRLNVADTESTTAALGVGAFHSWETLDKRPGLTDDGTETLWRANLYLALNQRFNDQTRLANTVYYQPALDDTGDYRVLDEASLNIKISDHLDFKLGFDLTHDSRPPQSVEKTDISYHTGLEYTF